MRPPLVVPFHEASERGPEIPAAEWHVKQSCAFVLQRANEAFDYGYASVLADGTDAGNGSQIQPPDMIRVVGNDNPFWRFFLLGGGVLGGRRRG